MLQSMRDKMQGLIAGTIAIIIALTFALWGVQNLRDGAKNQPAAKVNGEEITQEQVRGAYEQAKRNGMARFGSEFSFDQKIQAQLKQSILQQLIDDQVVFQAATKMGLGVSKKLLVAMISGMPIFQVNGRFSESNFHQLIKSYYSEQAFWDEIENAILRKQLERGIVNSAFVLPNEIESIKTILKQQRDFGYFTVSPERFAKTVKVAEDDVKKYYDNHQSDFLLPEKVSIQYVELSSSDLLSKTVKPTEEQLKQFYHGHIDTFSTSTAKKLKADAKIMPYETVVAKVKQMYEREQLGRAFTEASDKLADLVYTNSDSLDPAAKDLGLKVQETELFTNASDSSKKGILANNKIIKLAFSDVVLKQRYNSNLIEVGAGKVVVLRIKDHVPEMVQPLDQVRASIMQKLQQQAVKEKAANFADELLKEMRSGRSESQLAQQYGLVWNKITAAKYGQNGGDVKLVDAAFDLPKAKDRDISATVVDLNGSYAVLRLDKVASDALYQSNPKKDGIITSLPEKLGEFDYQLLLKNAMRKAKVEIFDNKVEK